MQRLKVTYRREEIPLGAPSPLSKTYIFCVLFLVLLAEILWSEKIMNISHIQNGKYPIYKNFKLNLIEKEFINVSNCPDGYILGIYDMAIDSRENLYFVTWGKVLKFNKMGKFQRMFCNIKGEGPGQLRNEPQRLTVDRKDNLYITDRYHIAHFNSDGEFIKNIKVYGVEDFILSSKNLIFSVHRSYEVKKKKATLH